MPLPMRNLLQSDSAADVNMKRALVTLLTSQPLRSWLKELAYLKVYCMLSTLLTFQWPAWARIGRGVGM